MSDAHDGLIARLEETLTCQRYSRVVVHNYCRNARDFLSYLSERSIALEAVTPTQVSQYLRCAVRHFRERRGRPPASSWTSIPRAGIHALLRFEHRSWPPEPDAIDPGEGACRAICRAYEAWLRVERGLAAKTVDALVWEARHFLSWHITRTDSVFDLSVRDVDAYFEERAPGLRRKSLKDVAERLRSLLRYLHNTGHTATDLAPHVIAPILYAYEAIPSVLRPDQIAAVLLSARDDPSPMGLRDHAILQLLSTYGLREGEITHLRLDDIDWRAETLHIRHSKTGAHSLLPLMEPVGEALLDYLRQGRPKTDAREIFIRDRAPYRPLMRIYSEVRRRLVAADVQPPGKCGPHIFRHARAVELLRAFVPQKIIGDLLGHRSTEATIPYLKLATEDLRAIALEVPGREVRP